MICPICQTKTENTFTKIAKYYICGECNCVFTLDKYIYNTNNAGSPSRNEIDRNHVRIKRVKNFVRNGRFIDFGCGEGHFVDLIQDFYPEYTVRGIDLDTKLQLDQLKDSSINVISMVEVIEHILYPVTIVYDLHRVLADDGILYLETSFTDYIGNPEQSPYVSTSIDHCLVHSKKSLQLLFKNFTILYQDCNVVIFKKK